MKKRDIVTEYVPEYAKELVWDENYEALTNQEAIFEEQAHRINRLIGKVDVIVTDSPVLFSEIYGQNNSDKFKERIWNEHNSHDNFNLFINRSKKFEKEGRIHNLDESIEIDNQIKSMLEENLVYYKRQLNYSQVSRHKKVQFFLGGAGYFVCSQYKASASFGVSILSVPCGLFVL